jgi:hypothetical protein
VIYPELCRKRKKEILLAIPLQQSQIFTKKLKNKTEMRAGREEEILAVAHIFNSSRVLMIVFLSLFQGKGSWFQLIA